MDAKPRNKAFGFIAACIGLIAAMSAEAHAVHFERLTCDSIPTTRQSSYNVQVNCTATIHRPGSARWYSVYGQSCPVFCASIGGQNVPSWDGFSCVSGEERPWSAIGVVDFSPTGCWHNCNSPEGRAGAFSVGSSCYAPGQKRDNDRTDRTVGCHCATGDTGSDYVELGIHNAGGAQVSGVSSTLSGWTNVQRSVKNDMPGRIFDVVGTVPLGGSSTVAMVLNVQGACGTSASISGVIAHPSNTFVNSGNVAVALPACVPQCQNGIDDDGDGVVDSNDPGCADSQDNNEGDKTTQCQDGIDNDGDGASDLGDFSCGNRQGNDETNPKSQCQNGIDDDGDGVVDGNDPGCSNVQDNNEGDKTTQCQDGIDNDGDGAVDHPSDAGCSSRQDNNEGDFRTQCQDGLDNDGDGASDLADFSCSNSQDNDETNTKSQCQNGTDDDGDGVVDSTDAGCSSAQDNNEGDKTTHCQDGIDNDGDGAIDHPADAACSNPQDNNEGDVKTQCQDGIDNDNNGAIDFPNDRGCTSLQDVEELDLTVIVDPTLGKITPIAECVDLRPDGTLVAHFGYQNIATTTLNLPIGTKNYFTPGAVDRGQPNTFFTGRVTNVFTVQFPSNETLSWVVGNVNATASITTERCKGDTVECTDTNNTKTLASLDNLARSQRTNVNRLTQRILDIQGERSFAEKAESYREQAQALYLEQWTNVWGSFPQVSKSCTACAVKDLSASISSLNLRAKRMHRVARLAINTLKQARGGNLRRRDRVLIEAAHALYERFQEKAQSLPRFDSSCS